MLIKPFVFAACLVLLVALVSETWAKKQDKSPNENENEKGKASGEGGPGSMPLDNNNGPDFEKDRPTEGDKKGQQKTLIDDSKEEIQQKISSREIAEMLRGEPAERSPENSQTLVFKRSVPEDQTYVHTPLNGADSSLSLTLVEHVDSHRRRRSVGDEPIKWGYQIPYVLDSSYIQEGEKYTQLLKRGLKYISDRTCITFVDVTNNWVSTNPTWFTEQGYSLNAYVLVKSGTGCTASAGPGDGTNAARPTQPCFDFETNVHEMLHVLDSGHDQQGPIRDKYMTINYDNIIEGLKFTYAKSTGPLVNDFFDPESYLMYGITTWSRNGMETYFPIREDLFDSVYRKSENALVFKEINQVYKCNEYKCNNNQTNCGPGYFAFVHGQCRCVCPSELDPATNCQSLINQPSTLVNWPSTPMALFAGGANHQCPVGFGQVPGWLSFTGIWPPLQKPVPTYFPTIGSEMFMPICSKTLASSETLDWESWPPGATYCIIKPQGEDCGGGFEMSTVYVVSMDTIKHNGTLGDVEVGEPYHEIIMNLCCRDQEPWYTPIELPNARPFRFFAKGDCPTIKGMKSQRALLDFYAYYKDVVGDVNPWHSIFTYELQLHQCYYSPPVYGCNQDVTLNANSRSVTINTPRVGNTRAPNRRCFYRFNVPENSQVRVTFLDFDMDGDDEFLVKRFHEWQAPYRLHSENLPHQFVSETDYLTMEYFSSWTSVPNRGVTFKAEVILPQDLCYNVSTRGKDYDGPHAVTETYEACLPWAKAIHCTDFPYSFEELLTINLTILGSTCRNPKGALLQPYCYTSIEGDNCRIRYCDVCHTKELIDVVDNCTSMISSEPNFCTKSLQRVGCALSCGLDPLTPYTAPSLATCGTPTLPADGTPAQTLKASYQQGESVTVTCSADTTNALQSRIFCTKNGWTQLTSACFGCKDEYSSCGGWAYNGECTSNPSFMSSSCALSCNTCSMDKCQDRIPSKCAEIASLYPKFCQDSRFKEETYKYCMKTCGLCFDCQDKSDSCDDWAANGECQNNPSYMNVYCKRACKTCTNPERKGCSAPTLPSDGKVVGTLKAVYLEGDSVTVACNISGSTALNSIMTCTSNGWTPLTTACYTCVDKNQWCPTWASKGECTRNPGYMLVNCKKSCNKCDPPPCVDNDPNCPNLVSTCTSNKAYMGVYCRKSCGFCTTSTCVDLNTYCPGWAAIGECVANPGYMLSSCNMSCGVCNQTTSASTTSSSSTSSGGSTTNSATVTVNALCVAPTNATYTRTSASNTIKAGQYMTFACNSGYLHAGGDLMRMCSGAGQLLGQAPVCQAGPMNWDVHMTSVRKRLETLPSKLGVLFDNANYRVPFAGKITHWHYYCDTPGSLHFLVFRPNLGNYTFLGHNAITCEGDSSWTYKVPASAQISVQKNDVVGVYSPVENTLSVSDCEDREVKLMVNPTVPATVFDELLGVEVFTGTKCLIPSLGYRMAP